MKKRLINLLIRLLYKLDPNFVHPLYELERLPKEFHNISWTAHRMPNYNFEDFYVHKNGSGGPILINAREGADVRKTLKGWYI